MPRWVCVCLCVGVDSYGQVALVKPVADSTHACNGVHSFACQTWHEKKATKKFNEIVEYGKVMWRFSPSSHKIPFFPSSRYQFFVCAVHSHAWYSILPTLHFSYGVCVHEMSVPQPNEPFETYNFLFGAVCYRCTPQSIRPSSDGVAFTIYKPLTGMKRVGLLNEYDYDDDSMWWRPYLYIQLSHLCWMRLPWKALENSSAFYILFFFVFVFVLSRRLHSLLVNAPIYAVFRCYMLWQKRQYSHNRFFFWGK